MEHLLEFNQELVDDWRVESSSTGVSFCDLAFERLSATLDGEAEIETSDRCAWQGTASGKTQRIDRNGGDPRETDGILSVIITEVFNTERPPSLNAADAKRLFGHLVNFFAAARRQEFRDSLHVDTPAFGTATMISEAWPVVAKVKLIFVTNAIYNARTDAVLAGEIADIQCYRAFATVFTRSEARRTSSGRRLRNCNHGFGECRNTAYPVKADILETSVVQKRPQRGHRSELDVAVVPERSEMLNHLLGDGESEVLEISVI